MAIYDAGDLIRIVATFYASGGGYVDPASIYLQIKNPLGSISTYGYSANISRTATGAYYYDQLASVTGGWLYRWSGQPSTGLAAGEGGFEIRSSLVL